jgi:hypothetical protein
MRWYVIENTAFTAFPEWIRTVGLSSAGQILLPAAMGDHDNEALVAICACEASGEPLVVHQEHLYVPSQWLRDEYPAIADLIQTVEAHALTLGTAQSI